MKIIKLLETANDTNNRLSELETKDRVKENTPYLSSCAIYVNPERTFQTFHGFGGAITESVGYVLSKLSPEKKEQALKAFFDSTTGNNYKFTRTHMNSSDFSLCNWACVEQKDETLSSFSMKRPDEYIIPTIKEAQKISNNELKLMLSPWSPPAWMKDNNDMNHGGKLKKEYYSLWAKYFTTYLLELRKRGLLTEYISIQNEPQAAQSWDSCIWTAEEESDFAINYLKPALLNANFNDIKILVWDHNRDLALERFTDSMKVKDAEKAIDGVAFHWYMGANYQNIQKIAEQYPTKEIVFSEGCVEGGPRNGAWFTGERYAHNIINDLNSGCTTWIDWNIALDMQGGPNHANNFCDAPLLVDYENNCLNYQSSYYYIGHFSRVIKPNAKRISCIIEPSMIPSTVDGIMQDFFESTAFLNTDGTISLIVNNRTEENINYKISFETKETINLYCPPRAIQSIVIKI